MDSEDEQLLRSELSEHERKANYIRNLLGENEDDEGFGSGLWAGGAIALIGFTIGACIAFLAFQIAGSAL